MPEKLKNVYREIDKPEKEFTHPYRIYSDGNFSNCFDTYARGAKVYREKRDKLAAGHGLEFRFYVYGKGFKTLSTTQEKE